MKNSQTQPSSAVSSQHLTCFTFFPSNYYSSSLFPSSINTSFTSSSIPITISSFSSSLFSNFSHPHQNPFLKTNLIKIGNTKSRSSSIQNNGNGNSLKVTMSSSSSSSSNPPSWSTLQSLLYSTWENAESSIQKDNIPTQIAVKDNKTNADPNSQNLYVPDTFDNCLRLFNQDPEKVRVTLYRDPAYWCPYCQRVQLQLEVKKIPYRMRFINMRCYGPKPSYYTRMVPSGLLPAIQLDNGPVITESLDIMLKLEQEFPENNPLVHPHAQRMANVERDCFARWCSYLFRDDGSGPTSRGRVIFEEGLSAFVECLKLNTDGSFLAGNKIGLVDIMSIPFFERYAASILYWKNYNFREDPKYRLIHEWMRAMEQQCQPFRATQADVFSTAYDIPPQYGTPRPSKDTEHVRQIIDSDSWHLPLVGISASGPEHLAYVPSYGEDGLSVFYRLEAAGKLIHNHVNLLPFVMRGSGHRPRTVTAPLSDPDAVPNDRHRELVDTLLRWTAYALIQPTVLDGDKEASSALESWLSRHADPDTRIQLVVNLCYFRNRVGVPRDMTFPAARHLRAYLNWACERLLGKQQWDEMRWKLDPARDVS